MKIKRYIFILLILFFTSYSYAATVTIQAEDYDEGGEGVAYHDVNTENTGDCNGGYREDEGVDICTNDPVEGCHVGHTYSGEWTNYTYDFPVDGIYNINLYVGGTRENANGILYVDGENPQTFNVQQTETWHEWNPHTLSISVTKGPHTLKIEQGDVTFVTDKLEIVDPIDPLDTTKIKVSWDANDPTPEGYRVYGRSENGEYNYDSPMATEKYPDGNIVDESIECIITIYAPRGQITKKYFVVRAFEGDLESPDSDEADITIDKSNMIEAPTGLTLIEIE